MFFWNTAYNALETTLAFVFGLWRFNIYNFNRWFSSIVCWKAINHNTRLLS